MQRVYDLLEQAEEEQLSASQASSTSSNSSQSSFQSSQEVPVKTESDLPQSESIVAIPTLTARNGTKQKKRKSLMSRMVGEVTDLTQPAENIRKEVQDYLATLPKDGQTVLEWWAIHEVTFPNVARLARNYLSIPPTEVTLVELWNPHIINLLSKSQIQ